MNRHFSSLEFHLLEKTPGRSEVDSTPSGGLARSNGFGGAVAAPLLGLDATHRL